MADTVLPDLLLDSLHCPVCFHCYEDPRNLPCQHTFCRACIDKMAAKLTLTCPLCNTSHEDPVEAHTLPKNFALCNVLDCLCEDCKKRQRSSDCHFCEKGLCVCCAGEHAAQHNEHASKALTDLHNVVSELERQTVVVKDSIVKHADRVKAQIQSAFQMLRVTLDEREQDLIAEVHRNVHQSIDSPWQKHFRQYMEDVRTFQVDASEMIDGFTEEASDISMSDLRDVKNKVSEHQNKLVNLMDSLPASPSFSFTYSSQKVLEPLTSFGCLLTSCEDDAPHRLTRPVSLDYLPSQAELYTIGKQLKNDVESDELKHPWGVAASPEGDTVVTDSETCKLYIFHQEELVLSFGGRGRGDGLFYRPRGVAISQHGNIYVSDSYNNRIQSFDPKGNFCGVFGRKGSSTGQFNQPMGLAVDGHGYVYVCDSYNYRVQVFDQDGSFIRSFGSRGHGSHQFSNLPCCLAVSHTGKVVVTDMSEIVRVYNTDGDFLHTVDMKTAAATKSPLNMVGVCVDAAANFILASEQGFICLLPGDGATVRPLRVLHGTDDVTCCVRGISYSADGVIHVCDSGRREITAWQTTLQY